MIHDYLALTSVPRLVVVMVSPHDDPLSVQLAYGCADERNVISQLRAYQQHGPRCSQNSNAIAWGVLQTLVLRATDLLYTFLSSQNLCVDVVILLETECGTVASANGSRECVDQMVAVAISQCGYTVDEREEDE
jgi:hypothetical protein